MKHSSFDATISALNAEKSALDVETSAFGVETSAFVTVTSAIAQRSFDATISVLAARCGDIGDRAELPAIAVLV